MKRLLTFFVMLVATLAMYADNPVVVTAGNPVVFNEAVQALVEVDYSKTMVKDQTLGEYLKAAVTTLCATYPATGQRLWSTLPTASTRRTRKACR